MTAPTTIDINGFTNRSLDWASWLLPVPLDQATPQQLKVLDDSHAQARQSAYYLTLAHQPVMLRHRTEAYNLIMYAPGGLPRAEREPVSYTHLDVYKRQMCARACAQSRCSVDTGSAAAGRACR